MSDDTPKIPAPIGVDNPIATSATSDEQLVASWVANLRSEHSRINFRITADRFLAALGAPMRRATVENVRHALETITDGMAPSSKRQVFLRVKSLLSYGHRVGYLQFNAGAVIKAHAEARSALSARSRLACWCALHPRGAIASSSRLAMAEASASPSSSLLRGRT